MDGWIGLLGEERRWFGRRLSGVSGNSRASSLLAGFASMAAARFGQWPRHRRCRSPLTR
jgi:hypothetical protein